ncbi:MAG: DUF971 domain-containing protein [Planctomycetota bacterium]
MDLEAGEMAVEGGRVLRPEHLDLDRERALTVRWSDGRVSIYPVRYLRKMSPSAEAKQLREEIAKNPLTVLPSSAVSDGPLRAEALELVGHYAVRVRFSDGHDTGIYSWRYLREIDPSRHAAANASQAQPADSDKPEG